MIGVQDGRNGAAVSCRKGLVGDTIDGAVLVVRRPLVHHVERITPLRSAVGVQHQTAFLRFNCVEGNEAIHGAQPHATDRTIIDDDRERLVSQHEIATSLGLDAVVTPPLAPLRHDAKRNAADQKIEHTPQGDNQQQFVRNAFKCDAPDGPTGGNGQKSEHRKIGPCQCRQVALLKSFTLGRHVEIRRAGIDDHRGDRFDQVERLNIFIQLGNPRPAHGAVDHVLHEDIRDQKKHRIGDELLERSVVDLQIEKHIERRRDHECEARNREQPEERARRVSHPLGHGEPLAEHGFLQHQDLQHALTPARTLTNERDERFRLQTGNHRAVNIERVPATGVQFQCGLTILGDGLAGKACCQFKSFAAQNGGGPAKECAVPFVQTLLDD